MSTLITTTAQIGTIKDAGGNATAMTVDSSGRIKTPARPAFMVERSANISLTEGNSHQVLPFDNTIFDVGNNFSTSNHNYVCPIAGLYHFALNVRFDNIASGGFLRGIIYKGNDAATNTGPWGTNDGFHGYITNGHGTSYHTVVVSGYLQCDAGDIVTAMGGHDTDTNIVFHNQATFSGAFIG